MEIKIISQFHLCSLLNFYAPEISIISYDMIASAILTLTLASSIFIGLHLYSFAHRRVILVICTFRLISVLGRYQSSSFNISNNFLLMFSDYGRIFMACGRRIYSCTLVFTWKVAVRWWCHVVPDPIISHFNWQITLHIYLYNLIGFSFLIVQLPIIYPQSICFFGEIYLIIFL